MTDDAKPEYMSLFLLSTTELIFLNEFLSGDDW